MSRGWGVRVLGLAAWAAACSQPTPEGPLRVDGAEARVSPAGIAAVYLTVRNPASHPDRLLSVEVPGAGRAELHEVVAEGSLLRMEPRPAGFAVPARGTLALATGGKHVMVYDVPQPTPDAGALPVVLRFERAGPLQLRVPLRSALEDGP